MENPQTPQVALAVPGAGRPGKLTKVVRRIASDQASRPVQHWGMAEVLALVESARRRGRGGKGERDALLIQTIFDGVLRVSEALGLRPTNVIRTEGGSGSRWTVRLAPGR